jgi:trimeric autotransporter adhesin
LKKLLFLFSLLISSALANAQTWVAVGNGVSTGGYVNTLFVYDSVMYMGGYFNSPGNNIAQLNDTTWSSLGSGINNRVCTIGLYEDTIYMGGYFTRAGGHSASCITKWTGSEFSSLPFNFQGGQVSVIQAYHSLLYIGGQFDSVNHKRPSGLVTWDGKKTDSVSTTHFGGFDWSNVFILTTYKNVLLLGFGEIGGYGGGIGDLNDSIYTFLGNTYFYTYSANISAYENTFCVVDTTLYFGGSFLYFEQSPHDVKDTVNNIAMWNGKKWSALGKGIHGTVNAVVSYNNLIVAAGSFDSAGGVPVNNIAAWNGTTWSALGNGVNGTVYTLAVYDSNLYAGGSFTSPGNGIAKFNPTLKIPPIVIIDSVNIFPNPNMGQFTVVCNTAVVLGSHPIIEVYNLLGEKVYSAGLVGGNTIISLGEQAPGIYIYRIITLDGNLVNPGKLVVE